MSEALTLRMFDAHQGYTVLKVIWTHAKAWIAAGHQLVIEIRMESKTRDQERKYHSMIGDISKQAEHIGSKWEPEDWKRLLIDKFAREMGMTHGKIIPNLDKTGIVEVGILSRNFSRKTGSEFIEWLYAWGAEHDIEWREAKQWMVDEKTGEVIHEQV